MNNSNEEIIPNNFKVLRDKASHDICAILIGPIPAVVVAAYKAHCWHDDRLRPRDILDFIDISIQRK